MDFPLMYILNEEGEPEPCDDMGRYSFWHATDERRKVRQNTFDSPTAGPVVVSTVFLGTNHAFDGGPPVLWETMVFANDTGTSLAQRRYRSRAAAIAGHEMIVREYGGSVPSDILD